MKKSLLFLGAFGLIGAYTAQAGEDKVVVMETPPVIEEDTSIGASLSAGYDSKYIFRGVDFGDNDVWVGVDYSLPTPIPIDIGAWYINPSDGDQLLDDELDLYASISQSFGAVDVWFGYTAYLFPEAGSGDTHELGTGIGTALGPIDVALDAYYDLDEIEGWFFEFTAGHEASITDNVSLSVAAGISYSAGYNSDKDGFNNVLLRAGLPIALTESATFEPYIAGTISLDAIEDFQDDELFGGASLSVSF